ncbi:hypothetical protein BpHYR1_035382 [Brachionus plicatilis]|uniref:Uncharacterized protein n=1 Tax=Brachionus plicatilis TaxID=10195 RepID=A0A3M7RL93_BRAPC|nr:hypothetical protein BpHYR1_035382 [Brachionus plicatilis]
MQPKSFLTQESVNNRKISMKSFSLYKVLNQDMSNYRLHCLDNRISCLKYTRRTKSQTSSFRPCNKN